MDIELASRFAVALGLGILLGMERERTHQGDAAFAGVRTFSLIALLGAMSAFIADRPGQAGWAVAVAAALAALVVVSYYVSSRQGDIGITTEVTALLVFLLGALCAWGHLGLAAALAVAAALLLSLKEWLHTLADRIERADVEATLKFAIITVIILPLLPNQNYGPDGLEVINPYKIWLMVVLISALNFLSYVLVKALGGERSLGLVGLLGGLVSSTAVTLGFSQRSQKSPGQAAPLALGILLAWTVMFVRVAVQVAVVNLDLAARLALGLSVMGVVSALVSFVLWRQGAQGETASASAGHNPFELSEAIKFGLLFGVVIFVAKTAEVYFGAAGLYLAGALAGLTDVDAISLSMAQLAANDPTQLGVAARTVLIAVLANTLVKSGMVLSLAAPALKRKLLPGAGLLVAAGGVAAVLIG